jgi:hypothetical protein
MFDTTCVLLGPSLVWIVQGLSEESKQGGGIFEAAAGQQDVEVRFLVGR